MDYAENFSLNEVYIKEIHQDIRKIAGAYRLSLPA